MDKKPAIRTGRPPPTTALQNKPRIPCRFHARGSCLRGDACPYAHGESEPPKPSPSASVHPHPSPVPQPHLDDSRSQILCRFFAKGNCRNDAACPFAHFKTTDAAEGGGDEQEQDEAVFRDEQGHDNWTRELGGAWAQFEDGAAIAKVSLPTDFSAVRLHKLPPDSTPGSVTALLSDMGMVVSAENVRVALETAAAYCSADVKVEDPLFAKAVCSKLEATPIPVPMPRGSGLHRVDCRRVRCSWHRPTRTAWLNFGSETTARKVWERFSEGVYKVLGYTVKANAPTRRENRRNSLAWTAVLLDFPWTVMLTDLPGTAQERDVYKAIPKSHEPRNVEMGKPSYRADIDFASAIVKSMLLRLGPLESWEVSADSKGKRIKAQARFAEEAHAREAASALNDKPLSFGKTARLTVRLMTLAKFKVSARIYEALRGRLGSQAPVWASQHVQFVPYPPYQGYRVLKLEGEDSRLVAQAKGTLERIIGGEVARKDGKDLWSASLGRNGDEYWRLKRLELEHRVVILRDRRKSQLRLFGPEENCRRVTEALESLLSQAGVSDGGHVIELNADEFQWACRGGFKALAARLGDAKATFDIVSAPKRILIGGSKADYTAALAVMASRQAGPPLATPSGADAESQTECSVCWTEAEDPIRTSCDHVYCAGCFADLCQAEASASSTEFRISCVGAAGGCEKQLALAELQALLSSAAFEAVLEASFASYIRRHPAEFRYCSTPDCGQIYRATAAAAAAASIFTCAKCLIPTCTACCSPHPGITCAEHREIASGGYEALEKIKKKLGIKDCPKCKTAMEKTDGCNHMTCRGCGAHICWVCMATFGSPRDCYDHLNEIHGGIGLDIVWY